MKKWILSTCGLMAALAFTSCNEKIMVEGRLYYTPSCPSHNGHLIIQAPDSIKVIKNKIDKEFQSSNLLVRVTYVKAGDQSQIQGSGCQTGEAIRIKEIEKI